MMDYPTTGQPTMEYVVFKDWLEDHNCPILGEYGAEVVWQVFTNRDINPAFGLAVMEHEGQCGKAGAALANKNLGNLRPTKSGKIGRAFKTSKDHFRVYHRYIDGLRDMADLIHNSYANMDAGDAIRRWAPPTDNNNTENYVKEVKKLMDRWRK